jgi:hypothetical protein
MARYIKHKNRTVITDLSAYLTTDGNIEIAEGNGVAFGPTSLTGVYSGIEPPVGGYTLYFYDNPNGEPSIYLPKNDAELVFIYNHIRGTQYTLIGNVLSAIDADVNTVIIQGATGAVSPWQISNCQIAFSALDPAGYNGSQLSNLAPNNTSLSMNVVGSPSLVNNTIEFGSGQYAIGDYYDFAAILPNVDNGTETTDFTFVALFEGGGKDKRNFVFDLGFNPTFKLGYQYTAGAVFGSILVDINGDQTYFSHNSNHERFVGDGVNINYDEEGNQFIGKLGMMGYRATHQGSSQYLIEDVLDGKPTAAWNPPSNIVTAQLGGIDFTWRTASWAARKPTINAGTTTGTPSSTGVTKFKGLYYYDRALSDAELQSIYDAHNI